MSNPQVNDPNEILLADVCNELRIIMANAKDLRRSLDRALLHVSYSEVQAATGLTRNLLQRWRVQLPIEQTLEAAAPTFRTQRHPAIVESELYEAENNRLNLIKRGGTMLELPAAGETVTALDWRYDEALGA